MNGPKPNRFACQYDVLLQLRPAVHIDYYAAIL